MDMRPPSGRNEEVREIAILVMVVQQGFAMGIGPLQGESRRGFHHSARREDRLRIASEVLPPAMKRKGGLARPHPARRSNCRCATPMSWRWRSTQRSSVVIGSLNEAPSAV